MNAQLVKTEADYEAALARLDAIFEAEPGTPEGDEAELLTALIEMYEEKAYPMGMPTPLCDVFDEETQAALMESGGVDVDPA